MRALTIRQPYAWAVAAGRKRVENRSWFTDYRGPVLIHAGKSREELAALEGDPPRLGGSDVEVPVAELAFGAVIGVAELADCLPVRKARRLSLPFTHGPHCWVFEGARLLAAPVPCPGLMSLWLPPEGVLAAVLAQLG
jgi:hypothetical protein